MTDFNSLMEEEAKAASDVWNLAKKIGVGFVGSMAGGLAAATSGTAVMAGQALTGKPVDPNVIPVMQQAVQQKVVGDLLGQSAAEAPSSAAGKLVAEGATVVGEANQKAFADAATRTGRYWEGVTGSTTVGGVAAAIPQIALDAVDMLGRGVIPTGRGTGPTRNIYGGVQTAAENDPQVAATLDKAIQMEREGVPMLDIFNQTNAFKSRIDGMWRLWVSDEGASLNIKQAIKGKSFAQMADRGVENKVLLGSLLKHDKMFEMYPELRTLPVKFEVRRGIHSDQGVNSPYGVYDPNADAVTVFVDPDNPESVDPNRILNTVVHEANHAIQTREGFTNGSSEDFVQQTLENIQLKKNPDKALLAARKAGDADAEEAARIVQGMFDAKAVYNNNVGEIDSFLSGDNVGRIADVRSSYIINHTSSDNVLKNTLGTDPVKNVKDFIDAFPLVWGNRRVLEYFIDDPKLIKEYEDKYVQQATEHRKAWEGNKPVAEQRAFHGGGQFDAFDHRYMGTGEGAQAFGWGSYLAQKFSIAKGYKDKYGRNQGGPWYRGLFGSSITTPSGRKMDAAKTLTFMQRSGDWYKSVPTKTGAIVHEAMLTADEHNPITNLVTMARGGNTAAQKLIFDWSHVSVSEDGRGISISMPKEPDDFGSPIEEAAFLAATRDVVPDPTRSSYEVVIPIERPAPRKAAMYETDVPENTDLAYWDALIGEQPPAVKEALDKTVTDILGMRPSNGRSYFRLQVVREKTATFEEAYRLLQEDLQNIDPNKIADAVGPLMEQQGRSVNAAIESGSYDEIASFLLLKNGLVGHRFEDGDSRGRAVGEQATYNYVIYEPSQIKIIEANTDAKALRQNARERALGPDEHIRPQDGWR